MGDGKTCQTTDDNHEDKESIFGDLDVFLEPDCLPDILSEDSSEGYQEGSEENRMALTRAGVKDPKAFQKKQKLEHSGSSFALQYLMEGKVKPELERTPRHPGTSASENMVYRGKELNILCLDPLAENLSMDQVDEATESCETSFSRFFKEAFKLQRRRTRWTSAPSVEEACDYLTGHPSPDFIICFLRKEDFTSGLSLGREILESVKGRCGVTNGAARTKGPYIIAAYDVRSLKREQVQSIHNLRNGYMFDGFMGELAPNPINRLIKKVLKSHVNPFEESPRQNTTHLQGLAHRSSALNRSPVKEEPHSCFVIQDERDLGYLEDRDLSICSDGLAGTNKSVGQASNPAHLCSRLLVRFRSSASPHEKGGHYDGGVAPAPDVKIFYGDRSFCSEFGWAAKELRDLPLSVLFQEVVTDQEALNEVFVKLRDLDIPEAADTFEATVNINLITKESYHKACMLRVKCLSRKNTLPDIYAILVIHPWPFVDYCLDPEKFRAVHPLFATTRPPPPETLSQDASCEKSRTLCGVDGFTQSLVRGIESQPKIMVGSQESVCHRFLKSSKIIGTKAL